MSSTSDSASFHPGALLRALRPHQWSKNVFVLGALVFAAGDRTREVGGPALVGTLLAFAAFCMASSDACLPCAVCNSERRSSTSFVSFWSCSRSLRIFSLTSLM